MARRGALASLRPWGIKKVAAVATVLAVVSISLAVWSIPERSDSAKTASPQPPPSTTSSSKVRPTKASAEIASNVEKITNGCGPEVYFAQLDASLRAANISSPGSAQSPADVVHAWWADYPAIAADIVGLQEKWSARVVPLVADGTPNITRQEAATLAAQFNDQVLADCRSMASRNVVGGRSAAVAPPPTSEAVTSPPAASGSASPLANVDWSSVQHPLDCSVPGLGTEIMGKDFADVTGDGFKEAFVRVACMVGTGSAPVQVEVFDGGSPPLTPRLLGVLAPVVGTMEHTIRTVTTSGSLVTVSGREWSFSAPSCCSDTAFTQPYIWSGSRFSAGLVRRSPASTGITPCSDGVRSITVGVGPNASCPFALKVQAAWNQAANGTDPFDATSPVTNSSYSMRCVGYQPTVCRGGDHAVVYIR